MFFVLECLRSFLDPAVGCGAPGGGNDYTQLYNLDAVACACATASLSFLMSLCSSVKAQINLGLNACVVLWPDESVMVGLFSIFTGKECGAMCNLTGQHCSPYNRTGEVSYGQRTHVISAGDYMPCVRRIVCTALPCPSLCAQTVPTVPPLAAVGLCLPRV